MVARPELSSGTGQLALPISSRGRLCSAGVPALVFRYGRALAESRLQLHTGAELDHAIGRDVEEIGDAPRIAHHGREDALTPRRHAAVARRRNDLLARKEIRNFHGLDLQSR